MRPSPPRSPPILDIGTDRTGRRALCLTYDHEPLAATVTERAAWQLTTIWLTPPSDLCLAVVTPTGDEIFRILTDSVSHSRGSPFVS